MLLETALTTPVAGELIVSLTDREDSAKEVAHKSRQVEVPSLPVTIVSSRKEPLGGLLMLLQDLCESTA